MKPGPLNSSLFSMHHLKHSYTIIILQKMHSILRTKESDDFPSGGANSKEIPLVIFISKHKSRTIAVKCLSGYLSWTPQLSSLFQVTDRARINNDSRQERKNSLMLIIQNMFFKGTFMKKLRRFICFLISQIPFVDYKFQKQTWA